MADIFNEIDDDLRHERYRRLWDRYGVLLLAGAAAIVLGVAGWTGYNYWAQKRAEAAGDVYYAALRQIDSGDTAGASAALTKLASEGPAGYTIVARLQLAALAAKDDRKAGLAAYDAVAKLPGAPKVVADVAAIEAGYLALDVEDAKTLEARLARFLVPGQPFRHAAREILVLAAIAAGDWAAAASRLDEMQSDAELPQTFQRRVDMLSAVVTGSKPQPAPAAAPVSSTPATQVP